jgi:Cu/Zn superoxide dismutase
MARAVALAAGLAAVLVSMLASAATAQMDSCSGDLPASLVANYSGMACQPVWNNFVLRVRLSSLLIHQAQDVSAV